MSSDILPGTKRLIDGRWRIYYDGYWIKFYDVPADTLLGKKRLIEALTRRLFNHVEHGLNVPGARLEEARRAYESEVDPRRRRVKGGMLAGALFNRAADVITKLVELQAVGVAIHPDNELMRQCGEHLQEALTLGKMVLHRSGEEGIDELWGEPFKAFAFPMEDFYTSRYLKIAMTMREIDEIADKLIDIFGSLPPFAGISPLIIDFARAAQSKVDTLRTDDDVFDVWTTFVVSGEALSAYQPRLSANATTIEQRAVAQGTQLLRNAKDLISYIARARMCMPKSTRELIGRCWEFRNEVAPVWGVTEPMRSAEVVKDRPATTVHEV
jgi:hypothetical protein